MTIYVYLWYQRSTSCGRKLTKIQHFVNHILNLSKNQFHGPYHAPEHGNWIFLKIWRLFPFDFDTNLVVFLEKWPSTYISGTRDPPVVVENWRKSNFFSTKSYTFQKNNFGARITLQSMRVGFFWKCGDFSPLILTQMWPFSSKMTIYVHCWYHKSTNSRRNSKKFFFWIKNILNSPQIDFEHPAKFRTDFKPI